MARRAKQAERLENARELTCDVFERAFDEFATSKGHVVEFATRQPVEPFIDYQTMGARVRCVPVHEMRTRVRPQRERSAEGAAETIVELLRWKGSRSVVTVRHVAPDDPYFTAMPVTDPQFVGIIVGVWSMA